ncbi:MAG: hypothetical protein CM15mV11_2310 [Caudoviricetes sp.]|nr:MAG: hypothetical protein CM15mV11_2310 [Caudoviricetes sp.]
MVTSRKPISLVGTNDLTITILSYCVDSSSTSWSARYNEINVLPVPAAPCSNKFLPLDSLER